MSDWQYRDRLAEQVREALGDFDDRTQPVIVLVAALRAQLDQERADNERLRAALADIGDCPSGFPHYCANCDRTFIGNPTALLSGRGTKESPH